MALTLALEAVRPTCAESIRAFVDTVGDTSEHDLLGPSRCHGWSRLDVVTHVIAGWQEVLGGMVSPVDDLPTVDAATYWTAFAEQYAGGDPVALVMSQRRRSDAYLRPASACEQLVDVAAMLLRGVESLPDRRCLWQGHVFTAGDFLAIWAVEDVVHMLDLDVEARPPAAGLALTRATVEELAGEALPGEWDDTRAVLVGTGRSPVPRDHLRLRDRLPALG